jgi:hypothetical protein
MSKRDLKDLIERVRREGWRVSITGSGHLRFAMDGGPPIYSSRTPSAGLDKEATPPTRKRRRGPNHSGDRALEESGY